MVQLARLKEVTETPIRVFNGEHDPPKLPPRGRPKTSALAGLGAPRPGAVDTQNVEPNLLRSLARAPPPALNSPAQLPSFNRAPPRAHTAGGYADLHPEKKRSNNFTGSKALQNDGALQQIADILASHEDQESSSSATDEDSTDPMDKVLAQIKVEHNYQMGKLRAENNKMTSKINSLLQATWSMTEDGWHGNAHGAEEGTLVLTSGQDRSMEEANGKHAWIVPENFDNPQRKGDELPDNFPLHSVWHYEGTGRASELSHITTSKEIQRAGRANVKVAANQDDETVNLFAHDHHWYIMSPFSTGRVAWDVFGMFLLFYDIVMVPMNAFQPKETVFMKFMDWLTLLFWTADMVASALTGYTLNGIAVMDPRQIWVKYLKGWFVLDLIIVGPDWVFTLMGLGSDEAAEGSETARLLRSFRMVRVLRLLRLAKLKRLLVQLKDRIHSELVFKAFNILQFLLILLFGVHFMCACWYAIGDFALSTEEKNWIEDSGVEEMPVDYQYFTAFHFILTNFGFGATDVQPCNSLERLFAILMMFCGIVCFCSLTAYMTNAMVQAQDQQSEASKQLWLLRRYLRQNKVKQALSTRALRYAEFWCKNQKETLSESKVTILENLSENLRFELKFECSFSVLMMHPLFSNGRQLSDVTVHSLVETALSRKSYACKDVLFREQNWATHMYFVVSGDIEYTRPASNGLDDMTLSLGSNDWLCEHALWVQWMARGTAIATNDCEIILVDCATFGETVCSDAVLWALASHYADNYSDWLNDQSIDSLHDVSIAETAVQRVATFLEGELGKSEKDREKRKKKKRQERASRSKADKPFLEDAFKRR